MSNLEDYTKEEIITAVRKIFRQEKLLLELPIIRYNRMCDESKKISEEASTALRNDDIKKATELFEKSNKLWESANDFIEKHRRKYESN